MYLLFDIGGTKTRIAFSADGQNFDTPIVFGTPQQFSHLGTAWKWELKDILGAKHIEKAIGGVPGVLDSGRECIVNIPQLPSWNGQNLKKELEGVLNAPVFLENDADLVGLGEAVFGAGKGKKYVMYLTISTGVGGTRVVDGALERGVFSFEPGHQVVVREGREIDILENFISGGGLKRKYKQNPEDIVDPKIWDEVSWYVALGIRNALTFWSPEIVVLSGSVLMNKIDIDRVEFYLKQFPLLYPEFPPIVKGKLEDYGGLYGAVAWLQK